MKFHLFVAALAAINVWGQGALAPAGPPAPTMKTLDQIEPRRPISSLPVTLVEAGSYYITTNLSGPSGTSGITISADNVTIDLDGHVLSGVPGANRAIFVSGVRYGIVVRNGTIRDWPLGGLVATSGRGVRAEDLYVANNGGSGIDVGPFSSARHCTTVSNLYGVLALSDCVISDCIAIGSVNYGVSVGANSVVSRCASSSNGIYGFIAETNCTILDCVARRNLGSGFYVGSGTVRDCQAAENGAVGIRVNAESIVESCACRLNSSGIFAGDGSVVRKCSTEGNTFRGIDSGNVVQVIGCTSRGNSNSAITALTRALVKECTATESLGAGIVVGRNSVVHGCVVSDITGTGVAIGDGSQVRDTTQNRASTGVITGIGCAIYNCTAVSNANAGFLLSSDCLIQDSLGTWNQMGVNLTSTNCQVTHNVFNHNSAAAVNSSGGATGCVVQDNQLCYNQFGVGLFGSATNNLVIRNTAIRNSSANYSFGSPGNNHVGPIQASPGYNFTNNNTYVNWSL